MSELRTVRCPASRGIAKKAQIYLSAKLRSLLRATAAILYMYLHVARWTQEADRLSYTLYPGGLIFFSNPKDLRVAASKRFVEDGRVFTAGNGGGRQKKYSSCASRPAGPPWRKW